MVGSKKRSSSTSHSNRKVSNNNKDETSSGKFIKKLPTSPEPTNNELKGNKIITCRVADGDIIALTSNHNGHRAFLVPLIKWLKMDENTAFVHQRLKIHHIGWEVDPNDPLNYKEDNAPSKSRNHRYNLFMHYVSTKSIENNTAQARERFASAIIRLNNHPAIQSQYNFGGALLHYGGDITPQNEEQAPALSRFLTLQDTMDVLRKTYPDPNSGKERSITDMLQQQNLLRRFFLPEHIPILHQLWDAPEGTEGNNQSGNGTGDNIHVPEFNM